MSVTTFTFSRAPWAALVVVGLSAACSSVTDSTFLRAAAGDGALPIHSFVASGPLEYSGRAAAADSGGARVTLTLRNAGRASVRVEHGACAFGLRVHTSTARAGRPAWDNRLPANTACIDPLYSFDVAPGASRDIDVGRYTAAHVLGDSLPAGRYHFTIVLEDGRDRLTVVPAGDADLTR